MLPSHPIPSLSKTAAIPEMTPMRQASKIARRFVGRRRKNAIAFSLAFTLLMILLILDLPHIFLGIENWELGINDRAFSFDFCAQLRTFLGL
jgi:hypothetical protein